MHEIVKQTGGWAVEAAKAPEFLALPSGEFIRPQNVEAIRVQPEKADTRTGEVSARVHIDHRGSWFTVRFASEGDARLWAAALADLCNRIARGDAMGEERGSIGRAQAQDFIDSLRQSGSPDEDTPLPKALEAAVSKAVGQDGSAS